MNYITYYDFELNKATQTNAHEKHTERSSWKYNLKMLTGWEKKGKKKKDNDWNGMNLMKISMFNERMQCDFMWITKA